MLIVSITDIRPGDETCKKLSDIAQSVSIMDMRQVYLLVEPYMNRDGETLEFPVGLDNQFETRRIIMAMAIINYACFVHAEFQIPTLEQNIVVKLKRKYLPAEHEKKVYECIGIFHFLLERYGV